MSIMWRYLDKRSATIAAIKDYGSMKFIIENTDEQILKERERIRIVSSDGQKVVKQVDFK